MDSFGRLMFQGPVRAEQEKRGSAATYARMADRPGPDALSQDEIAALLGPRLAALEEENRALKARLADPDRGA